ncbi:diaminopimelate epimerase [Phycisphaera mikurensis]|uniref:Diaminopimelate epimerase n=1 Tax=Phycisphaera mikurensis (strain NBRC 102666 / KCTC 22515 / FYK2301M01) TaxID=1142394 RepID=I0IJ00_PHYMF|nr:diaminopimelate epimerase [Phycisphaera mikurensis]MBB6443085.1 diaminopimelate epimerase [Phycisphaera mikurensis]BAM05238.1 diaminopimelate epimerase [Phycisphaera mikurensis NBRC 102666]
MLPFVKYHGLGNDYVYVDGFTHDVPDPAGLARAVSPRNFAIGADGLILVLPATPGGGAAGAHCRMRMFNADGSEGQMCGNGLRCVVKFAHDHALFAGSNAARPMRVETGAGVLAVGYDLDAAGRVATVTVDMGRPILAPERVPVDVSELEPGAGEHAWRIPATDTTPPQEAVLVSMGNPHAVLFRDDPLDAAEERRIGAALEHHRAFPERMNLHAVHVRGGGEVDVVHWERGSGPTLACGTGAAAVCVAGVLTGRTPHRITTHLPGGPLVLDWAETTGRVAMTGPAVEAFTGVWRGPL